MVFCSSDLKINENDKIQNIYTSQVRTSILICLLRRNATCKALKHHSSWERTITKTLHRE